MFAILFEVFYTLSSIQNGDNMETDKRKFGLFTSISMIAGIVIGSGIFFKTDDILIATSGNVFHGIILWIVGAVGIVFGGLSVSEYARHSESAGGLITYCEMAWGKTWGFLAGWFQIVFYFPAIIAVLSWIGAVYIGLVLGIDNSLDPRIWIMTIVIIVLFFIVNIVQTLLASKIQNIGLVVKLAALVTLSIIGMSMGDFSNITTHTVVDTKPNLFAGLIACAFAFDGWFVAPSISHEIKNPKRNLPLALIIAPFIILIVYLSYFIGINVMLGPELVMSLGDGSVGYIVNQLFGNIGTKIVYIMVIISVLAAVNGLVLGYIRMPYALAIRDEFPKSQWFKKLHPKFEISIGSALLAFCIVVTWLLLHGLSQFQVQFMGLQFAGLQVDNIPVILTYFFFLSLYVHLVPVHIKKKEWLKLIAPVLAIAGACLVIYGGMSQENALVYFIISFVGIGIGAIIKPKHK